jgi:hypothetical protein
MPEVSRNVRIADQIAFVDGLSGTGKTMMGSILSSFDRVEVQRMDPIHEYICAMRFLGRMEEDAAVALVRMYADLALYNLMIGRESNFRWKDLSGVISNPGGWRYLLRLLQPDGEPVLARIKQARPILHIHSHQILGISRPLFLAFGEGLRFVVMVRNPLYLVANYRPWMGLLGNHPRDFTICFDYQGVSLPWFALEWEGKYTSSNMMDRAIYCIERLARLAEDALDILDDANRQQVVVVPFERFVVDPWPYLHRIEAALATTTTVATGRTLGKQKVPRRLTTAGRDRPIYRRYSWQRPSRDSDESTELQKRWDYVEREATKEGLDVLERLSSSYQERYLRQ